MKKSILIVLLSCSSLFGALENFNVATWNLQGSSAATESKWNVGVRQLVTGENAADILMVQEAGVLPATAMRTERIVQTVGIGVPVHEYVWNLGARTRPSVLFIYYSRVDMGINRVNLAIVSRQRADEVIVLPPPTEVSRPIIGIRIGDDAFFSIHALPSGRSDAGAIVQAIHGHFVNMPQINWMIAGDFNREPQDLMQILDSHVRSHIRIVAPNAPTQSNGRTLDYAVTGNSGIRSYVAPTLVALLMFGNIRSYIASDHFPINFRCF